MTVSGEQLRDSGTHTHVSTLPSSLPCGWPRGRGAELPGLYSQSWWFSFHTLCSARPPAVSGRVGCSPSRLLGVILLDTGETLLSVLTEWLDHTQLLWLSIFLRPSTVFPQQPRRSAYPVTSHLEASLMPFEASRAFADGQKSGPGLLQAPGFQ